jgi:ATP-binding protein involved in chromosome partitioning
VEHRPVKIVPFPNGELGVVWDDGHESYFGGHALRCACACAQCVDEMSGQKLLRDAAVPADVRALAVHPVGNYAVAIEWSDGHDTGIYTFEALRALCSCDACTRARRDGATP